jgi:hypothetical protein
MNALARVSKPRNELIEDIEILFNRVGFSGATLVVVAIGGDVYGATDVEPVSALHAAARKAADDRASHGRPLDPNVIIERGLASMPTGGRTNR